MKSSQINFGMEQHSKDSKKDRNTKILKKANKAVPWPSFLNDVLICSLGAYGGPEAHVSVYLDQMVVKRKYLSEEELIELIALCSILPEREAGSHLKY